MDGVVGWFERRGEIPLSPARGVREYGPLSDDPDRSDESFTSDGIRGVAFTFEYCDARGWASTRTVRCLAVDQRYPAILRADCNVRKATKSFRFDRIISIANHRTGQILSADEHIALLSPYLPDEQIDPATRGLCELRDATKDGVFALLQLAMADGRLGEGSQEIVLNYVMSEAVASDCRLPPIPAIELWIDNLAPPLDAVVASVTNLLARKEKFVRLLPWLLKIVRSQESFAAEEESVRELIAEVRQHFRSKSLDWPGNIRRRELLA